MEATSQFQPTYSADGKALALNQATFSGIEALRDLFAILNSNENGAKAGIDKLANSSDKTTLLRLLDLSQELQDLIPKAEKAALSALSDSQWRSLKGPELEQAIKVQDLKRISQPIDLERVVIVPKISKIEYRMRKEGLSFDQVVSKLTGEADDVKRQIDSHNELKRVRDAMLQYFRESQIVDRDDLSSDKIKNASLVIALGGDDHLGYVTQKVIGDIPVLGMKADPMSVGAILSCSATELSDVVRKLESADYQFEPWLRMKLTVDGKALPPILGTGFFGDKHAEFLSRNLIQIEDREGRRLYGTEGRGLEQRSSGVLVYTGTGSTSWPKSAQRYLFPEGKPFPRSSRYIEFVLREPSDTVPQSDGTHGMPKILHAVIHEGERLTITSLNKDGGIVSLDSVLTLPFPRGSSATIEIDPEPLWVLIPNQTKSSSRISDNKKLSSQKIEMNLPDWLNLKLEDPREGNRSRTLSPGCYPKRHSVDIDKVSWTIPDSEYRPEFFEHEKLKTADWAEPSNISKEEFIRLKEKGELKSYLGDLALDPLSGRPLNPVGRTGIAGRGLLGKHGANFAVDPIVIYQNKETKAYHLLVIERKDGGWALPGGMVDKGEDNLTAMLRELNEETGIESESVNRFRVAGWGRGLYSDDPRSTDNAWIETTPGLFFVDQDSALNLSIKAGSDAKNVNWLELTEESLRGLYASHAYMVADALKYLIKVS